MHIRRLDTDERETLADMHRLIASAQRSVSAAIASGIPGLEWVQANLSDAASDVAGLVNNSEPMSFR